MSATPVVSPPDVLRLADEEKSPDEPGPKPRARIRLFRVVLATGFVLGAAVAAAAFYEARTSYVQARVFSDAARTQIYGVQSGASDALVWPADGPYDLRLGYSRLPAFTRRLTGDGLSLEAQARWSPEMVEAAQNGLFVPYHEKMRAGLEIQDRDGQAMSVSRWPERIYPDFQSVPRLVREALVFIENRELLTPQSPEQNPAVEWDRMAFAVAQLAARTVDPSRKVPGASTLATQLEKFRHSPDGRTHGAKDKLRQMASASLRAYQNGEDTTRARRDIVVQYVNTVPLGAVPGYGEVQGIGDALWAWFGTDFDVANNLLADDFHAVDGHPDLVRRASVFREVLGLFLAQRRPQNFLVDDRPALDRLIDDHLFKLEAAGLIDRSLMDMAMRAPLAFRRKAVKPPEPAFFERKAADAVRTHLMARLGVPRLYDLDRLDLTVRTTFDGVAQTAASTQLARMRDPAYALKAGLREPRLLGKGDPAQVLYSFTLFERSGNANLLRVQTDSFDGPFNLNDGMKLELGSTAKLRTLVTYLDLVADLYDRLGPLPREALLRTDVDPSDALTRWGVEWLASHAASNGRTLRAMLDAAMDRTYSANPGEAFMTGGGLHHFGNFNNHDDHKTFTVRQATYESVNLVYIRLMRDVVRHLMFQAPGSSARLLQDASDTRRQDYLARFADTEGRLFQEGFFKKYHGKSAEEAFELLVQSVKATPRRLATIFRFVKPDANLDMFGAYLRHMLPDSTLTPEGIAHLYEKYAPDAFGLADQGFLAKVHPLELWTVSYLRTHQAATWNEVAAAGAPQRQAVYQWLFRTSRKNAQDKRIKALLEVEAFLAIHKQWRRMGYPFPALVPSYATALGSSGDRPTALAELIGVLQNDGVRLPTERLESYDFAVDTPYETHLRRGEGSVGRQPGGVSDGSVGRQPGGVSIGVRVLRAEVAQVARETILGVVEQGTAKRVKGAYKLSDGTVLPVGGKTGTGDNRRDEYARGGKRLRSTVMSRTATFAFFIGDRWFGVLTAYVPGVDAAKFDFTSALPSTLLKLLAPGILPSLMERTLVRREGDGNGPRHWRPASRTGVASAPARMERETALVAIAKTPPQRPHPNTHEDDLPSAFPVPRRLAVDERAEGASTRPVGRQLGGATTNTRSQRARIARVIRPRFGRAGGSRPRIVLSELA